MDADACASKTGKEKALMDTNLKGLVFDIQGYSVHDGPGCRTLVFLSGCQLRCEWCANPEGQELQQQVMYRRSKCTSQTRGCRLCAAACPKKAITIESGSLLVNRSLCAVCITKDCSNACLNEAMILSGKYMTVNELMRIIKRDHQYWRGSGGVTFSGGEPLGQKKFICEVLKRCQEAYIHTAIETTACVATEHFFNALQFIDWAFIDLKHMDSAAHRSKTGVGNELILKNIAALANSDWPGMMLIRIPVIEGYNDDENNIKASAEFLLQNGLEEVNILPFHRMGDSKWQQLGKEYPYRSFESTTQEKMDSLAAIFNKMGVNCYQGSLTPF